MLCKNPFYGNCVQINNINKENCERCILILIRFKNFIVFPIRLKKETNKKVSRGLCCCCCIDVCMFVCVFSPFITSHLLLRTTNSLFAYVAFVVCGEQHNNNNILAYPSISISTRTSLTTNQFILRDSQSLSLRGWSSAWAWFLLLLTVTTKKTGEG